MNDLENIKSKLDIVEVISSYVPEVKKSGANYKANCPFHSEKTASFMINPSLQIFKCFGCGKGGDVVKFIQEIERVEFVDALKIAAERAGVKLTNTRNSKNEKDELEKKRLIEANLLAAKYYNYILLSHKSGSIGRKYAEKRLISGEIQKKFMVGYSPDSRNGLKKFLNTRGFEDKELLKWGLLVERNGIFVDKFRNRLLQPIFNLQGDVAGFSGRYVGESKLPPKYLNSPETLLYKKQEMLYGFFQGKESIRKNNFVILVEGNIDILSSHRVGVENIAAPLGTSFTLNQAALIKRFAEEVYFCFDTDSAGTKALIRALEIVESIGLKHRVIDITGFQDADELIVKNQNLWSLKVQNSVNTVDYILKKFSSDLNMDSIDGKTQFYSRILPVLKIIKDEVLLSYLIKEVSILVEISEQAVKEKLDKGLQTLRLRPQSPEVATGNSASITPRKSVSSSRKLEAYFLILLIQLDNFQKYRGMEQYFQDENCLNIYKALVNLSDDSDFSVVSDMLDEEGKSQLEEIVLFDTSKISSPENELQEVYQRMAKIYLKKEILKLRKSLSDDSENQQIVEKLSEYTMKLKNL